MDGPLISQLPRFCRHHVEQNIRDLLQSKPDGRPRAFETGQIYKFYQQILNLSIVDVLLNAENLPSYMQCKELLGSSTSDLEMMFLLVDLFHQNCEFDVATTRRRHLIKEFQLVRTAHQADERALQRLTAQCTSLIKEKAQLNNDVKQLTAKDARLADEKAEPTLEIMDLAAKNAGLADEKVGLELTRLQYKGTNTASSPLTNGEASEPSTEKVPTAQSAGITTDGAEVKQSTPKNASLGRQFTYALKNLSRSMNHEMDKAHEKGKGYQRER